jgi:hypothetical protein
MQATLTFELPDERTGHLCAVHALVLYATLTEIDQRLRSLLKHGGIEQISAESLAEELRATLADALYRVEE